MGRVGEVFDEVLRAYGQSGALGDALVFDRAASLWSETTPESLSEDEQAQAGEVFRRAAIAAVKRQLPEAAVWRSRGFAMFSLAGSRNGVAMVTLASALRSLSEGHKPEALQQIEVMHVLVDMQDSVVTAAMVRSAAFENEGIVRLDPGGEGPDPAGARVALAQAVPLEQEAGDRRRVLKLRASINSADYLEARSADDPTGAIAAAQEGLQSLIDEAHREGIAEDVVETAERNLALMSEGSDRLLPYQVI